MKDKKDAIAIGPSSGEKLSIAGNNYRIIISGEQTAGAFAVIDMLVPPGGGPGPHAHPDFQESFFVLEGEVEVKTETQTYTANKGAFITIPKGGLIHGFKNKTNEMARLLCTVVPSGLEAFFNEIGTPVEARGFLPEAKPSPAEMERLTKISEKYGQQLFPPDYLDGK